MEVSTVSETTRSEGIPEWFEDWFGGRFPESEAPYKIPEIAGRLDCSYMTVHRAVEAGELDVVRVGRLIIVPRPALREWVQAKCLSPHL